MNGHTHWGFGRSKSNGHLALSSKRYTTPHIYITRPPICVSMPPPHKEIKKTAVMAVKIFIETWKNNGLIPVLQDKLTLVILVKSPSNNPTIVSLSGGVLCVGSDQMKLSDIHTGRPLTDKYQYIPIGMVEILILGVHPYHFWTWFLIKGLLSIKFLTNLIRGILESSTPVMRCNSTCRWLTGKYYSVCGGF